MPSLLPKGLLLLLLTALGFSCNNDRDILGEGEANLYGHVYGLDNNTERAELKLIRDGSVIATVHSGLDGLYTFQKIKLKDGPMSSEDCDLEVTAENYLPQIHSVRLSDEVTTVFNIDMVPVEGSLSGLVKNEAGDPIGEAKVILTDKEGTDPERSVKTDIMGRYAFSRVRPGAYTLSASRYGYPPLTGVAVTVNAGGTTAPDLVLGQTSDLSAAGTANCYMVSAAGASYKFKATVMGNGATTPAFDYSTPSFTQNAPAIVPTSLNPQSAKVLWETGTRGSVIADGSVKVEEGYVCFTTAGNKGSGVGEGNAVIAVFSGADGTGTLLWSWHIWATDYDPDTYCDTYQTRPLEASGGTAAAPSRNYTVMWHNLGADATTSQRGTAGNYGLYYQWGRKDPFIGPKTTLSTGTDRAATDNAAGYGWQSADNTVGDDAESCIAYAVEHPTTFLKPTASPDWLRAESYADERDNLWGNPNASASFPNASQGVKSIYDPCPAGWRTAPEDAWTSFAKDGGYRPQPNAAGSFNYGWKFYCQYGSTSQTAFYPASGYYSESGEFTLTGIAGGCFASSGVPMNGAASGMVFTEQEADVRQPSSLLRAHAYPVRCVKE